MGLDMNLYKKTYVKNWEYMKPVERHKVTVKLGGRTLKDIKADKVTYITEEVGYWRKANQIHSWFVENVQNGNDDCGTYYVSSEQLQELLDIVNQVLASSKLVKGRVVNGQKIGPSGQWENIYEDGEKVEDPSVAQELLPNRSGFFFGSTEYDQWYYHDLELTKEILTECLKYPDAHFEYSSSW